MIHEFYDILSLSLSVLDLWLAGVMLGIISHKNQNGNINHLFIDYSNLFAKFDKHHYI